MSAFVTVARVSDFREGKIRRYFVEGYEIGVVLWKGRFYAFANRCPHADFQLHFGYVEDDKVHCPVHFAEFQLDTGRAVYGPWGVADLPVYPVRVAGEEVQVGLGDLGSR